MKTALALLVLAVSAPSAAAKSCATPAYPGAGSFTSLKVTKATCAKAKKVALAHYKCRTKMGPAGRCVKRVEGYACAEVRTNLPTEISARVTCKKKKRKVTFGFQQTVPAAKGAGRRVTTRGCARSPPRAWRRARRGRSARRPCASPTRSVSRLAGLPSGSSNSASTKRTRSRSAPVTSPTRAVVEGRGQLRLEVDLVALVDDGDRHVVEDDADRARPRTRPAPAA